MGERIVFAVAAFGAVGSAICVVTLRNAFRAAVALIGTLLSVAVLFLLQAAPFVAAIQVIVYAGAIVVLFLFVIAYLGDRPEPELVDRTARFQPFAWLFVWGIGAMGAIALLRARVRPGTELASFGEGADIGSPRAIGESFLNEYIVPFEATSLVLLVAAVAAVMLAKRAVQAEGGR